MVQLEANDQKKIDEIIAEVMNSYKGVNNEIYSEIMKHSSGDISELLDVQEITNGISNTNGIEEILLQTETDDDGGVTAMSGFYYQLLVTIYYMIEMFHGKWTNIVVDHHQDIIAYNDTTVRFIQVKTKNKPHCIVSDTAAYSEWIPKLLSNQVMFEGHDYKLEFELVSNCFFLKAPKVCRDFEQFYENDNFKNGFIEGDLFDRTIEKMSEYKLDEEKVARGIKAFRVKRIDPASIKKILCHDIGECFNNYYRADDVAIDMFISYLFKKCYFPESASIQIVREKDSEELLALIRNRIQSIGEKDIIDNSAVEVVGNFIEGIKEQYMSTGIYDEFSIIVDDLESELLAYFSSSDIETIFTLLSKYLNKSMNSSYFRSSNTERLKKESQRVFEVLLLVKLYFGGEIVIDSDSKKLLLINIKSHPFNLFGIRGDLAYTVGEAVKEFEQVFYGLDFEEQFSIVNNPSFKIILVGEFDNECDPIDVLEVVCKEVPEASHFLLSERFQENSIATVKNSIRIVDGEDRKIDGIHRKRRRFEDIGKMREYIKEELNFEKV
ncbi:dsDNA nuclease domain-containing protein [Trichococcus shcherbakoviae]|uniref:DUF4297 domain-containing protein n=1 Tax=Trichococcus shcherbakoviae subsp. psychrophilus TaxID=2585775 RepID=A0A5C5E998_9LACT|nr:dsDNA nuclease domain-containing protein [Trichococcus shcherbakoviae]TNV69739.1 DUF4297 domain-containing protein [Trichococcus shcherbakoviae subsp. psychrophilus]